MKGQKFPKPTEKHAKTLLCSGFFAVFVSRETDAENQIVPRETYIFHCLKYPFRYRFCARFYSLIVAVLRLKSYVKNRFSPIVFTSNYPYSNTEIPHKFKAIFRNARHDFTAARSARKTASPTTSHTPFLPYITHAEHRLLPVTGIVSPLSTFANFSKNCKTALLLLFSGIVAAFF